MTAAREPTLEPVDLAAIGVLAGGIAHDFNNLLSVILGYGERALNRTARGSRLHRDLESIVAAGHRGRMLVDQVLTLGGGREAERGIVEVTALAREVVDLLAPGLPRAIDVEADLAARNATIVGRAIDVHRLVMNLATNAVRAMPGGGTLRVAVTVERIAAPRLATAGHIAAADHVLLEVADSGIGIAPEILPRVFERFFTTRGGNGGTGLGLSLVHDIALEAGGAIDVESRPGAGSRFTVYLPRATHGKGCHA